MGTNGNKSTSKIPPFVKEVQVYLDAIKVIQKHGWCRGHLKNKKGAVCTMGALAVAKGFNVKVSPGNNHIDYVDIIEGLTTVEHVATALEENKNDGYAVYDYQDIITGNDRIRDNKRGEKWAIDLLRESIRQAV